MIYCLRFANECECVLRFLLEFGTGEERLFGCLSRRQRQRLLKSIRERRRTPPRQRHFRPMKTEKWNCIRAWVLHILLIYRSRLMKTNYDHQLEWLFHPLLHRRQSERKIEVKWNISITFAWHFTARSDCSALTPFMPVSLSLSLRLALSIFAPWAWAQCISCDLARDFRRNRKQCQSGCFFFLLKSISVCTIHGIAISSWAFSLPEPNAVSHFNANHSPHASINRCAPDKLNESTSLKRSCRAKPDRILIERTFRIELIRRR